MTAKRIEEAARLWKYIIGMCLMYIALIALFASERYVAGMLERERQLNYSVMGEGPAGHAEARASSWYRSVFIESGVVEASLRAVTPKTDGQLSGVAKALEVPLRYIESRLRTMWLLIFQFQMRVSILVMWWPYVFLIFIPVLIDGIVQRRISATNFSTPSPTMHIMAKGMLWIFLIGSIGTLFAPFPTPPIITPVMICLGAAAMWISMTMFAKSA